MRIPSSTTTAIAPTPAREPAAKPTNTVSPTGARKLHALDVFVPATTRAAKPTPLPENLPLEKYDGALMGGDGRYYPAGTRPEDLGGFKPRDGREPEGLAIFVNGVGNKNPRGEAQTFADGTGMEVVSLYNATQGFWKDATQTVLDSLDLGTNKACNSLSSMVYDRLKAGEPVRLIAHSQGALITSRALQDVKDRLISEGMSKADAEKLLANATVETFGGAATQYPDGPRYVHYVNRLDPVTLFSGWFTGKNGPGVEPGRGAKVVEFWDWSWKPSTHSPQLYLEHYQPLK